MGLDGDAVLANGDAEEEEFSAFTSEGSFRDAGLHVRQFDLSAGHRGFGGVGYRAKHCGAELSVDR